ncbi:MAG: hypothetical protein Q8Q09_08860 [Deltaproteobacteria bacterium]|nr:hypothetical protein [Deltaproteobacteria bacterium]
MKRVLALAALTSGITLGACVTDGALAQTQASTQAAAIVAPRAQTAQLVEQGFACMLRSSDADLSPCHNVAVRVGSTTAQFAHAEHDAAERFSVAVIESARRERLSPADRASLANWLDLSLSAARELQAARAGLAGKALRGARASNPGDLDMIESAMQSDLQDVNAHVHFDALARVGRSDGDGASEALWITLRIAELRGQLARSADVALRDHAQRAAISLMDAVTGQAPTESNQATDAARGPALGASARRAEVAPQDLEQGLSRTGSRLQESCRGAAGLTEALCATRVNGG